MTSSSAWFLGDWLVYGQAAYAGRYRDAVEQTSLDYQTLRNYAWVARRFPMPRRRAEVSFGHHAEVAALPEPEQDFWLRKASELGWSRNRLRREVRASMRQRRAGPEAITESRGPGDPGSTREPRALPQRSFVITVAASRLELWQQAAGRHELPVEAWAAQILDQAARAVRPGKPSPDSP